MKNKIMIAVIVTISLIISITIGCFVVSEYSENKKEENLSNEKEEVKDEKDNIEDEYYQIYFDNGKILYTLNKGEKKELVSKNEKILNAYRNKMVFYSSNNLYYYDINSIDNKTSNYVLNYIDLKTGEEVNNFVTLKLEANSTIRYIENNNVYYGCVYEKDGTSFSAIKKHNIIDESNEVVIERKAVFRKGGGAAYMVPNFIVDSNAIYAILDDYEKEKNGLYKIVNGKEELLYTASNVITLIKKQGETLYFIDNESINSFDLKNNKIEQNIWKSSAFSREISVFSDIKIGLIDYDKIKVIDENISKEIKINLGNNCDGIREEACAQLHISGRIDENRYMLSAPYLTLYVDLSKTYISNNGENIVDAYSDSLLINIAYLEFEK